MTQTEELVAGRELDALVAREVMGWTVIPVAYARIGGWSPSTDIGAAWQVVEHTTLDVRVKRLWVKAWDSWLWVAEIGLASGEGETAPLAICRAALAAVAGS